MICTLGPAVSSPDAIRSLVKAGMDVARLNFSHGSHGEHASLINLVRNASLEEHRHVGVMQDLQGPRIRVGKMRDPVTLSTGQTVEVGGRGAAVPLVHEEVLADLSPGDRIMIAGGLIVLAVRERLGDNVLAMVEAGGTVRSRDGVNLPDALLDLPALTDKDKKDIRFGAEQGVDMVALSFVCRPSDVADLRDELEAVGSDSWVVSKIERSRALDEVDGIIALSDGIMVARGDLGVEVPLEGVPLLQKDLIRRAHLQSRFAIIATQMLESMVNDPRPTRAEVSDVANAILDGSDAIMLSGETAVGSHPIEATETMSRIAMAAERGLSQELTFTKDQGTPVMDAVAHTACVLANNLDARCIVEFTGTGSTARRISKYRHGIPVYAFTPSEKVARRASVLWGVRPLVAPDVTTSDDLFDLVAERLISEGAADSGDLVIVVAGLPLGTPGTTNMVKAHRIP